MLVSERGLCAAMSEAAKHGGYRVRFNEDEGTVVILTDEWLVDIERTELPRKVLALIVEHFGYLPAGGCYEVTKRKDDFEVQGYMDSSFNADVLAFAGGSQEPAMNTGVTVWGMAIWIGESGTQRGVRPALFGLCGGRKEGRLTSGGRLAFLDEDSAVFFDARGSEALPEAKLPIWEALAAIDWWKAKEAEEAELPAAEDGEPSKQYEFDEIPEGDEENADARGESGAGNDAD